MHLDFDKAYCFFIVLIVKNSFLLYAQEYLRNVISHNAINHCGHALSTILFKEMNNENIKVTN
jgi:hypothetical protein